MARYSADSDVLAAGAWDKSLRTWVVSTQNSSVQWHKPLARHYHVAPILGVATPTEDGTAKRCFFGSAAKVVCEYDFERATETVIGRHEAPVKDVKNLFHLGSVGR